MVLMNKCSILSKAQMYHLCQPNYLEAFAKQARRVLSGVAMRCVPVVMLCLIASLPGSFAHADRPVISLHGGCITPSAPNEHIRLDVMRVTFRSKRDSYSVDAHYRLFNTGETVTVMVGVPKYGRTDRDEEFHSGEPIVRDFIRFDAWVNGRKVEFVEAIDFFTNPSARPIGGYCRHGNDLTEIRWMTKRVTFTEKAMTFIRVRYEAHYHNHFVHSGILADTGYYHDSVGRYWKDKIRRAFFVSDITDIKGDICGYESHEGRLAFTSFITMDEIRQLEPSTTSFHGVDGSWAAALWRKWGRFGPWFGRGGPKAPTPCNIDKAEYWQRQRLLKPSVE